MLLVDVLFFGIAFQGIFLSVLLYHKLKDWKVAGFYLTFSVVLLSWVLIWLGKHGLSGQILGGNLPDFSLLLGPFLLACVRGKSARTILFVSLGCFGIYVLTGIFIPDFFRDVALYSTVASITLNTLFLLFAVNRVDIKGTRMMSYALLAFVAYMIVFLLVSSYGLLTRIVDYGTALLISCFFYISGYRYLLRSKFRSREPIQSPKHRQILDEALTHLSKSRKYLDPDYRILDLARDLNVTEARLSEVIRCSEYDNFKSLINRFRIDHSKKLLRESDLKVLAVAMESGFNNKVSFNSNFKKFTGISPATYRQSMNR